MRSSGLKLRIFVDCCTVIGMAFFVLEDSVKHVIGMAFRVDFLTARFCKTLMSDVREVVRTGTHTGPAPVSTYFLISDSERPGYWPVSVSVHTRSLSPFENSPDTHAGTTSSNTSGGTVEVVWEGQIRLTNRNQANDVARCGSYTDTFARST
ncbi:hypothetical protein DFH94DRAFT_848066 [Russula ochroleuca]|uniref:Uncharacterized protein n=1 Tax=Russula ochroleuca TaxID=152965 RepID=A0A9P5MNQ8_9AGAM|nr:hypothetical protein DFH94DRAFT_848066 [Russula ochroleuca]